MLLLGLAGVVVGSQLGDQVRGVLRCVYRQGLWNDQQGLGKVSNGKLFSEELNKFYISCLKGYDRAHLDEREVAKFSR